jgi:hypothetical protein
VLLGTETACQAKSAHVAPLSGLAVVAPHTLLAQMRSSGLNAALSRGPAAAAAVDVELLAADLPLLLIMEDKVQAYRVQVWVKVRVLVGDRLKII